MSEPFLAEIVLFGGNFAPRGWAFCSGQILQIAQNTALFSLLGTTYGGDGRTTFALPDLRGRVPVGEGHGPGLSDRNLGSSGGTETHALTTAQVPAHTHAVDASGLTAELRGHDAAEGNQSSPAPDRVVAKRTNVNTYSHAEANRVSLGGVELTATAESAGGGAAHENRQPFLGVNYIIALQGVFPSRN